MPTRWNYWCTAAVSLGLSALVWLALSAGGKGGDALLPGFLLGAGVCLLALWLFFKAWRAAPDKSYVMLFYLLRVALVFGSILAAMFFPGIDALGVLVPQLFPMPVLAIRMLFPEKKGRL